MLAAADPLPKSLAASVTGRVTLCGGHTPPTPGPIIALQDCKPPRRAGTLWKPNLECTTGDSLRPSPTCTSQSDLLRTSPACRRRAQAGVAPLGTQVVAMRKGVVALLVAPEQGLQRCQGPHISVKQPLWAVLSSRPAATQIESTHRCQHRMAAVAPLHFRVESCYEHLFNASLCLACDQIRARCVSRRLLKKPMERRGNGWVRIEGVCQGGALESDR